MPRIQKESPTNIYWLFDMRPETLAENPLGRPFYCGKTIFRVEKRLVGHRKAAVKYPRRLISKWLNACGEHVRIQTMEIVPASANWIEREQFLIHTIRLLYPGGANITAGGQGTPGNVHTATARAKISAARRGKTLSSDHCRNISLGNTGKKRTAEEREKIGTALKNSQKAAEYHASRIGGKQSAETRGKMAAAKRGKKRGPFSDEWRANMSLSRRGKPKSAEWRAKMSASKRGKKRAPFSDEWRANLRAAAARRKAAKESVDAAN